MDYGCLMAYVEESFKKKILKCGNDLIKDSQLYNEDGEEYGRETEPHVTIKYGFIPDLTDDEVKSILKGVKNKFQVTVTGLSTFQTPKFDVVKFDIKPTEVLSKLRQLCDKFPNEDEHPNFVPHMTLAYVKKGSFKHKVENKNFVFTIDRMVYSPINGDKRVYKLL